ncbi:MAG: B12-binding domain-containing protein, partial [Bacteroidaceae bacterium]|nr:B12-binding domain-containing protein [Bacteroidaceae bacterium]
GALEALLRMALVLKAEQDAKKQQTTPRPAPAATAPQTEEGTPARLVNALLKGETATLEPDLHTLLAEGQSPLQIISGPLMQGMNEVGRLFGEGKMFLPQVVKTARTMKKATELLAPYLQATPQDEVAEAPEKGKAAKILLATVKGDVHDIGKNIVGVVLACNGFQVIDLGVMVPCDTIVAEAVRQQVDIVCLSGLITPSLDEMCRVAESMQHAGLCIPLFVGGATTSPTHTAVKIAPLYDGGVYHMRDAAQDPVVASQLLDPAQHDAVAEQNRLQQQRVRMAMQQRQQHREVEQAKAEARGQLTPEERRFTCDWAHYQPVPAPFVGQRLHQSIPVGELVPLVDWLYFFWAWRVGKDTDEGRLLRADAERLLCELAQDEAYSVRAVTAFYPATATADSITLTVNHEADCPCCGGRRRLVTIDTPRQQATRRDGSLREQCLSLCDFVSPLGGDSVGAFAATMSDAFVARLEALKESGDDCYELLLLQTLGDRLAEAASEFLAREYNKVGWGGIRPAVGYPSLPDQRSIFQLAQLIDFAAVGITLTENGAMYPQSSVSGLYISHPESTYFTL